MLLKTSYKGEWCCDKVKALGCIFKTGWGLVAALTCDISVLGSFYVKKAARHFEVLSVHFPKKNSVPNSILDYL